MRNLLVTVVVLSFTFATETRGADEFNFTLWSRTPGNVSPWVSYWGEVSGEVRYNLDGDKTVTACVGKPLGGDTFSIVPKACSFWDGDKWGSGGEFWFFSQTKNFSLVSYVQYMRLGGDSVFAWLQAETRVAGYLWAGLSSQVLKYEGDPLEADVGLSVKLTIGRFTLNVLPLCRVTPEGRGKVTLQWGVIYSF